MSLKKNLINWWSKAKTINGLDPSETQWQEVIDRRSREIEEGKVTCRPVEQVVQDIRAKLNASSLGLRLFL